MKKASRPLRFGCPPEKVPIPRPRSQAMRRMPTFFERSESHGRWEPVSVDIDGRDGKRRVACPRSMSARWPPASARGDSDAAQEPLFGRLSADRLTADKKFAGKMR